MQKNRKTVIVLILLAATAAFSTASISTNYGGKPSQASPIKFVGTYYSEGGQVVTYNADGTVTLVVANMFSDDASNQSGGRKITPFLGVWRKVGDNKIQVTTLGFATEQLGHNYNANGYIFKTKWVAVFDHPVKGVSPGYSAVNILIEGFLPSQNPVTDEPVFTLPLENTRAIRLPTE